MPNAQINPKFIQLILDQDTVDVTTTPTVNLLPGKYVKTMIKNKESLNKIMVENDQMLICKSCGRKGKYDVGMVVINVDKDKEKTEEFGENIQTTGYFRCKHCNSAGKWEFPKSFLFYTLASMLPFGGNSDKRDYIVGKNLLFDGSWHRYTTDAEDHLLNLLKENPHDTYIWNRLGNLYHKGNRPDLAVSAFEHSIKVDPQQVESHFTIGDMLAQISDLPNAGYHLRQMLIHADNYNRMPAENLREMLANGLQLLFLMNDHTSDEVPFLPTMDELEVSGRINDLPTSFAEMEFEIFPDEIESFFPLAEMYMGARSKEISIGKRTLKLKNVTNTASIRRIEQKKKQKLKKKKKK